jgi:UDP-N-acetylglucosamine/UDP-N-acetylgalactosamine 4-epimerase
LKILVTGGAGFIGSNLVEALLQDERVTRVTILDNLATGKRANIEPFLSDARCTFIEGDIRDMEVCRRACKGMDRISHQAALGSVPRSLKDPLTTNAVNITGTLQIFQAAVEQQVPRVIFAASSSTYGDHEALPKVEDTIGKPLSPYAVTKYVNELYADVFAKAYGIDYIGLRYFNVFGPRQDPHGAYAAVIPLFFKAALDREAPTINGDGSYSRDFTYVDNAVQANLRALFTDNPDALNEVYNVACGERTDLNTLWQHIRDITESTVDAEHGPNRAGDIPHSLASIEKARQLLGYDPEVGVKEGLERVHAFYRTT